MSATTRMSVAAVVLGGWITWISPQLATRMHMLRGGHAQNVAASQLQKTLEDNESLLQGPDRASFMTDIDEVIGLQKKEESLVNLIWYLLPSLARAQALETSTAPPMASDGKNTRMFEPETVALLEALIETHGYTRGQAPEFPASEDAARVPRNIRLTAARQVVLDEHLTAEQAADAIDAVMRLSAVQNQRVLLERRLMMQVPPEVYHAALND